MAAPRNYDFGTEHSYDPPLEIALERPLVAGDGHAFTARLPHPPNGDASDQAFFYKLSDGSVVGYFNRCTHLPIPMDWDDANFLDQDGFIMCRVHGARYDLATGERCFGPAVANLTRVLCEERDTKLVIAGWRKVR